MIRKNISRRLGAAIILLRNTYRPGITNAEKSSYYRSVIILQCTIIEGLVYELVKKHTTRIGHIVYQKIENIERHKVPKSALSSKNDFCICEKILKDVHIDDNGVDFGKLSIFLKNQSFLNSSEYTLVNWARLERNKIHLQGLSLPDTGYTNRKVEKLAKITDILIHKII